MTSSYATSTDAMAVEPTKTPAEAHEKPSDAKQDPASDLISPFHPSQYPDGGRQAWLCVAGGFCCLFCSFGWINCIGVFQAYYQTHQLRAYSSSTIAWIPSLEIFIMFLGGPIVGKLYDNYGPRWLLLCGTLLHVFGLMMTSLSTEFYQFILAQGICSPIGASMIFYPAMSCAIGWFLRRRALVLGILASGSSIGGVVLPILVTKLIPRIGFGWTMRVVAFLILGLMVVPNLTLRSRVPPHKSPLDLMEFVRPLGELPFLTVTAGAFFFFFGMWLPVDFIVTEAISRGMSASLAAYLVPIMNGASFFGRILPGYLGDKFGRFNVMSVFCFFTAILILALWLPARSNAATISFAAFYGFGQGTFVSMAAALIAQISPDVRKIGVRTGVMYAVVSFAVLIGSPIGGVLEGTAGT
ncbi:hypothetical protein LTR08_002345 [Meristemomyces frigidus]|nr:hypothetical protein LTR08_002345 [Meristemomyces frigidus]